MPSTAKIRVQRQAILPIGARATSERGWTKASTLRAYAGWTPRELRRLIAKYSVPTRGQTKALEVHVPSLFQKLLAPPPAKPPADEFKQRLLAAKAALAEVKLAETQRKLIDVNAFITQRLDPFCNALREGADSLERLNPEVAAELRRVFDEARKKLN